MQHSRGSGWPRTVGSNSHALSTAASGARFHAVQGSHATHSAAWTAFVRASLTSCLHCAVGCVARLQVKWFSPFLLAVYDPASETFQSLCRCMSGFSDEFYAAATARLGATALPGPKPYYDTHERPDVWFEPTEVGAMLEVTAAAGMPRCM